MADTIESIINSSSNRSTAVASFNANVTGGNQLDSDKFYKLLDKKWPIKETVPNETGSKGTLSKIGSVQGYTTGAGLISSEAAQELISTNDITDALSNVGRAFNESKDAAGAFGKIFSSSLTGLADAAFKMVEKEVSLRNKLNGQIGIAGELSRGYRDNIVNAYDKVQGMGYSFNELADTAIELTEQTGRFTTYNEKFLEDMSQTSRAFVGDLKNMGEVIRNFELIGVGAEKALTNINEAGKTALTLGLNTRKTTEMLTANLGKINEYGFKNGVQGLAEMVRKATEFRMSMDSVFKIAEDVMSPEKAIDLAANLQVLGGAVGALGDPFQMMYMATNNVEGLQDALIDASKSLATYNTEQGRFEITGVNLRRAKQMANELGISYQELSKGAIAAAERTSAAADLMTAGITVDEKQQEFITNLARMGAGGKMVIEVPPSIAEKLGIERTQALEDLDQATANAILENQTLFEKQNTKDIALNQFTETQKSTLLLSEITAMLKVEFANTYRGFGAKADEYIKLTNKALDDYISGKSDTLSIKGQMDAERNKFSEQEKVKSAAQAAPEKPKNVDNKPKEEEKKSTTENNPVSASDMERIMKDVAVIIKNGNQGTTVVQNNIDPTNPRDYATV